MNDNIKRLFENLIPFILLGVAIALVIGLFIMLSYVLVWGLIIGGIMWLGSFIYGYLFPDKTKLPPSSEGRIIEHDDKQ